MKSESKIFTFFCAVLQFPVSYQAGKIGSECMKMQGKALVWETIRENAVGDI